MFFIGGRSGYNFVSEGVAKYSGRRSDVIFCTLHSSRQAYLKTKQTYWPPGMQNTKNVLYSDCIVREARKEKVATICFKIPGSKWDTKLVSDTKC
jgi:hypothetical protein